MCQSVGEAGEKRFEYIRVRDGVCVCACVNGRELCGRMSVLVSR